MGASPGGRKTSTGGGLPPHTHTHTHSPHTQTAPPVPSSLSDGRIDASEIQTVVSSLVAEKFKSKAFKIGLIILGVFTTLLLGAMFGLTWAVVAALKDTQVSASGARKK